MTTTRPSPNTAAIPSSVAMHAGVLPPPARRDSDFRIIGEHLRKARQSNTLATRLHAQGLHQDAEQQNRLTHVFLQNALSRVKPQRPGH